MEVPGPSCTTGDDGGADAGEEGGADVGEEGAADAGEEGGATAEEDVGNPKKSSASSFCTFSGRSTVIAEEELQLGHSFLQAPFHVDLAISFMAWST